MDNTNQNKIRDIKQLGAVISRFRRGDKLTQKELASLSGLMQKTVSTTEGGGKGTKLETLFKILACLNLEIIIQKRNK